MSILKKDEQIALINSSDEVDDENIISNEMAIELMNVLYDSSKVDINIKNLSDLDCWGLNEQQSLVHSTGKFFGIDGINVSINDGMFEWEQPIIKQSEVGILGLIASIFNNKMYFLVQLKIEPGNLNYVQLSPTVQATRSNYLSAHKGSDVPFVDFFRFKNKNARIIVDQLQSEQGSRFFQKRNRNIIVLLEPEISSKLAILNNFIWLSLRQIKALSRRDNCVNMDLRTVISCLDFSMLDIDLIDMYSLSLKLRRYFNYYFQYDRHDELELLTNLSILKSEYSISTSHKRLGALNNWSMTAKSICHDENKFFDVIGVNIALDGREVKSWDQPIIKPKSRGHSVLFVKYSFNILYLLIQFKLECGNKDVFELAPTIQTSNMNPKNSDEMYLYSIYSNGQHQHRILLNTMQSEEGGRFYREENINSIILIKESHDFILSSKYRWVKFSTVLNLLKYNNYVNIQLRSLIALLDSKIL